MSKLSMVDYMPLNTVGEEVANRATAKVCAEAHDAQDAEMLLQMLGLVERRRSRMVQTVPVKVEWSFRDAKGDTKRLSDRRA